MDGAKLASGSRNNEINLRINKSFHGRDHSPQLKNAPGRTRTCTQPVKSRRLCHSSYECVVLFSRLYYKYSKYNHLARQCTGKESNLHHRFRRPGLCPLSYQCVRREGLDPSTSPLSRECSTSELTARNCSTNCSFSNAPGWIRTSNLRGVGTALGPLSYRRFNFSFHTSLRAL